MLNSLVINKNDSQGYHTSLKELSEADLTDGDVLIKVLYSTINYKDALAISGKAPVIRRFPMIPGIDLVGVVEQCDNDKFNVGDHVLLNGYGVGEKYLGGLSQKARISSEFLIPLPKGITPFNAMAIGTAGYTAMLCVMALEKQGITPKSGNILVTGATGGVGSFAIRILAELGYTVTASTGSDKQAAYLKELGADEIIDRAELSAPGKPLMKERWAAAIDSVGSTTLANVCASINYGGCVAACGLAQGMDFPSTVAPFILRGVSLLGIDSVMRPEQDRLDAWHRLEQTQLADKISQISTTVGLHDAIAVANKLLDGEVTGRVVVDVNA
ncbi:MDR family oxidoreductase [Colwellia sp. C1TZA3]|uniref:acrylyl-CoA reductase (NADPH) n=1 Tax=Colwellia sp. C1TZA3 TaxID=2508879 RepID=UPI0011BA35F0|nr:MDR family oxidoreductase [Colwellia sp. C1TZA3]TWX65758.1 oxidoreductase [Colwellia sp. C1TZA3]